MMSLKLGLMAMAMAMTLALVRTADFEMIPISLQEKCSSFQKGLCKDLHFPDEFERALLFVESRSLSEELPSPEEGVDFASQSVFSFEESDFAFFPYGLFQSMPLTELDIRNCSVQWLEKRNFIGASKLLILLLSNNELEEIPQSSFSLASQLQFLFLDSNNISRLYSDSFEGLDQLVYLTLENNELEELPFEIFQGLPLLRDLILTNNRLVTLDGSIFEANQNLKILFLNRNRFEMIPESTFANQERLAYLDLSENRNLLMAVFRVSSENLQISNSGLATLRLFGPVTNLIAKNNHLKSEDIYIRDPFHLKTLHLSNNSLKDLKFMKDLVNLQYLDLSDNPHLKTMDFTSNFKFLETLYLRNCELFYFPVNLIAGSEQLKEMDVSGNKLTGISSQNFQYLTQLKVFKIHENPWNCFDLIRLMDSVINPFHLSYTTDRKDDNFMGEYFQGIACMYRVEQEDPEETKQLYKSFPKASSVTSKTSNPKYVLKKFLQNAETDQEASFTTTENFQEMNDSPSETLTLVEASVLPSDPIEIDQELQSQRKEIEKLKKANKDLLDTMKIIENFNHERFTMILRRTEDLEKRLKFLDQENQSFWENVAITT